MTISSRSTSPRPTSSGGRSPLDHTCYPRAKSHSQSQSHSGNKPFEISPHSHSVHPLPKQAVAVVSANSAHSHSFHSSPTHAQSASHRSLQSRHLRQQHQHQHPQQQQPLHQRATASHPTHVQTIAHTHTHRSHPHSPHSTSPLNPSPRALAISTTALPLSFTTDKSPLSPRRPLNYPLPLSSDQHLAAVALMQERQESWTRIAQHAASSSSASTTSSRAGSVSPIQSVRGFGPSSAIGSSELGGPSGTGGAAGGNGNAAKTKGGKSGKPRKKVAKACLACQKSHLTCDEQRPCTRCVKKGIGEACVEGVRKKAKYLLEGDERGQQVSTGVPSSTYAQSATSHHSHSPTQTHAVPSLPHSNSHPSLPGPSGSNMPSLVPDLTQTSPPRQHQQSNAMDLEQLGHLGGLAQTEHHGQTQRVPDDIWLSAPAPLNDTLGGFGGIQGMQGIDSGHGNGLGNGGGNVTDNVGGIDTSQLWGDSGAGNDEDIFSFGPTAAANEFHMLDSMFGNMSPVNFPFSDSTPTAEDPFGLGLGASSNAGNANNNGGNFASQNGPGGFSWDSFNMRSTSQNGQDSNQAQPQQLQQSQPRLDMAQMQGPTMGMAGAGSGLGSNLDGQGQGATGFDLNSAWAAWTASGHQTTNPALANIRTSTSNAAMGQMNRPPSQQPPSLPIQSQAQHPAPHDNLPISLGATQNSSATDVPTVGHNANNGRSASVPAGSASNTSGPSAMDSFGAARMLSSTSTGGAGVTPAGSAQSTPQPIGEGPFSLHSAGAGLRDGYRNGRVSASEVYRTVNKPFDYTEGYHVLMQYLSDNFEQRDVLKVVHALAAYRPSLIALHEEDEVFLERSFQRTLIELEKLISYSATPTAVWRRTGEVCYANPEFCRLVGRTEADLCARKSYVYNIFAKQSVIAYWENFSVHAFENTTQNFFQTTVLERGVSSGSTGEDAGHTGATKGQGVQCSACFTIRRDVFDLPSVIIGQFLPIPADLLGS